MKMYLTKVNNSIEEVQVSKRTDKSVFILKSNGTELREQTKSIRGSYFEYYDHAKESLIQKCSHKVKFWTQKLELAKQELEKVKQLQDNGKTVK